MKTLNLFHSKLTICPTFGLAGTVINLRLYPDSPLNSLPQNFKSGICNAVTEVSLGRRYFLFGGLVHMLTYSVTVSHCY